ncbi:ricin-type beta-trefoil lectin domain protein [Streptomyces sp. NPDC089919]|uniref:ricin-type beta-trefoil lectin domain protein n=1 Tax=Streptomyces sp. NPDC089919 TaxID=3155188 RepID=UPI00342380CF
MTVRFRPASVRRLAPRLAVSLALALAASVLAPAVPATGAAAPDFDRVWAPDGTPVPRTASVTARHAAKPATPRPHYPVPGRTRTAPRPPARAATAVVGLTAATPAAGLKAGALPLWIAPQRGAAGAGTRTVTVTRAAEATARAAGVDGPLFSLEPTVARAPAARRTTGPGKVTVAFDPAELDRATGGSFAARGRLVRLPACALTTPKAPACRLRTPVATHYDTATRRLVADLTLAAPPAPGTRAAAGPAAAPALLLAAEDGPSGGGGSYAATALTPSSGWAAGGSSGGFTYQYPLVLPPSLGGTAPQVAFGYDSSSVDGRTSATNAQASWIGDGWDYNPGYLERVYKPCDKAGIKNSGDQCWSGFNAVLAMGSHSGVLVRDKNAGSPSATTDAATGTWRLRNDDGSRIEFGSGADNGVAGGAYAKLTDSGGTTYYFGANHLPGGDGSDPATGSVSSVPVYSPKSGDPCYDGAKGNKSWCQMWQRLSLDYIVDAHGNLTTFTWAPETNHYRRGAVQDGGTGTLTAYTRATTVARIDYGQRLSEQLAAKGTLQPAARVNFTTQERCENQAVCDPSQRTAANKSNWPDVPVDQECKGSGDCTTYAPTYFSTRRLASVTTQVRVNNAWQDVDTYTLGQSFPNPGDTTNQKALWLDSVRRTGKTGGSKDLPAVTFTPAMLPNRVDGTDLVPAPPRINRARIQQIKNETGAIVDVDYELPLCSRVNHVMPTAEDDNTTSCYPVRWLAPGAVAGSDPVLDWFNHYRVKSLTENDPVTGAPQKITSYGYGPAAWHRDDSEFTEAKYRTWGEFRGFATVTATTGNGNDGPRAQTRTTYRQGMHGDVRKNGSARDVRFDDALGRPVVDVDWLAGQVLQKETFDAAGGSVAARTVTSASGEQDTATHVRGGGLPDLVARYPSTVVSSTRQEVKADGTWQTATTTTTTDKDHNNRILTSLDTADGLVDLCTRTAYATGPDTQRTDLPAERLVVSGANACTATATAANTVERERTLYDGRPYQQTGGPGDVTRTEVLDRYAGDGTPEFAATAVSTYDAYGRVLSATDPDAKDDTHTGGATTTTAYSSAAAGELPDRTTVSAPVPGAPASEHWDTVTVNDPRRAVPLTVTDANSKVTSLTYDPLGRVTAVWLPGRAQDGVTNPSKTFDYKVSDQAGVPSAVTTATLVKDDDTPVWTRSVQLLDGFGRTRQVQETPKNPAYKAGRLISDTVYDSQGRVGLTDAPYYNNASAPAQSLVTGAESDIPAQQRLSYDGRGRKTVAAQWSLGVEQNRTTTTYKGADRTDVVPPKGAWPAGTLTDARGHRTELWQYKTPTATGDRADATVSRFTYTPDGKPLTRTDAAGNTWSIGYDLRGRQIAYHEPDKGDSSQTWDSASRLASTTDARGRTLTYAYDLIGRKTGLYEGAATTANQLAAWTFDSVPDGKGKPASATRYVGGAAGSGSRSYTSAVTGYDDGYRPTGSTLTLPGPDAGQAAGTTFTYTKDASFDALTGQPVGIGLPAVGGLPRDDIAYMLNDYGQMFRYAGATTYDVQTEYDAFGRVLRSTVNPWGKQVVQSTVYDQATGRVRSVFTDQQTALTGSLQQTDYTYAPSGDITSITNLPDNKPALRDRQCFTYDWLGRLGSAWTDTGGISTQPATAYQTLDQGECANRTPSAATVGGPAPYWHDYSFDPTGNRTKLVRHDPAGDTSKDVTLTQAFGTPGTQNAPTGAAGTDGGTGGPHALLSAETRTGTTLTGTDAYQYDAAGNTTAYRAGGSGSTSLTWNSEGKPATVTAAAQIKGGSGKCLDLAGGSTADGTALQIAGCGGAATQKYLAAGNKLTQDGKCVTAAGTLAGSAVELRACTGSAGQTWTPRVDGTLYNPASARCLAVPGNATADGTRLALADCTLTVPAGQKWTVPDTTTTYVYDPEGKLLVRRTADRTTLNLGDDVITVDNATGVKTGTRYYPIPGGLTVVRTGAGTAPGAFVVQGGDQHGTATLGVDLNSGAVDRRTQDPFGDPRGTRPAAWAGDKGFVGGQLDPGTGLTLLGAREYLPATARFISPDPLLDPDDPQSWNGYAYSDNDPVNGSDPSGLYCDSCSMDNPGSAWGEGSGPGCTNSGCYDSDGGGITDYNGYWHSLKPYGPANPQAKPAPSPTPKPTPTPKPSPGAKPQPPAGLEPGTAPGPKPGPYGDSIPPSNKWITLDHGYTHKEDLGKGYGLTPEKLMDTFKSDPTRFFPFPVENCSALVEGAECRLKPGELLPGGMLAGGNGVVKVHTTSTSVAFVVVSESYFDDPGSVITFTASEKDGHLFMQQRGDSTGSNPLIFAGVKGGIADYSWWLMGNRLRDYVQRPMTQSDVFWSLFKIPGING